MKYCETNIQSQLQLVNDYVRPCLSLHGRGGPNSVGVLKYFTKDKLDDRQLSIKHSQMSTYSSAEDMASGSSDVITEVSKHQQAAFK